MLDGGCGGIPEVVAVVVLTVKGVAVVVVVDEVLTGTGFILLRRLFKT